MMTTAYDTFDVVEVPFPFSNLPKAKIRKALVLTPKTMNEPNGATTLIMITSCSNSNWVGDIELTQWNKAGLKKPCYIRFKFFTPNNTLIIKKVGSLAPADRKLVLKSIYALLPQR